MPLHPHFKSGLRSSLISIFFWAGVMVSTRFAVATLQINPWTFGFLQLFFGGMTLLLVGGRGNTDWKALRHGYTWAIGAMRVGSSMCWIFALVLVSATEVQFLGQMSLFFSMALSAFFLARPTSLREWPGMLIAGIGIGFLMARQTDFTPIWLMVLGALLVSIQGLLTEIHPESQSLEVKSRCRYTGSVMAITSFLFLIAALVLGKLGVGSGTEASLFELPSAGSVFNGPTLLAVGFTGMLMRAPAMYLGFLSIRLMGAENYLMAITPIPFLIFALEWTGHQIGWFEMTRANFEVLGWGSLITAGAFYILIFRTRRHNKSS